VDDGRRQIHKKAAIPAATGEAGAMRAIVDKYNFAPIGQDACATKQEAVVVNNGDDAISARSNYDGDIVVATPFHAHVLRAVTEAIDFTVTNDGLTALANDGAIRFADDRSSTFGGFTALSAQLLDPPNRMSLR
jgi:hypothetical protein